ncbi:hypothetical protein EVAR_33994_1 [Eumeta japonica]|uniref:Uncharacterized protein n=1 Tax=Eumeta variegata TaxID=151549 RepID=A0A4C1X3R4_EUMVA|nr:hypothetical protein EVAR_33994_1 [Eumeta japonica]
MNCLGACSARPRADREYEKPTAPPYHCEPQPPFNPEFSTSHTYTRAAEGAPSASLSGVDHECLWVRAREDGDGASDGGADAPRGPRRSVYEGVDWPAAQAPLTPRRAMRELGRGGSLVAATIAALNSRVSGDKNHISEVLHVAAPTSTRALREPDDEELRRISSCCSERPVSTASETSERDSASVQSSEDPPPRHST